MSGGAEAIGANPQEAPPTPIKIRGTADYEYIQNNQETGSGPLLVRTIVPTEESFVRAEIVSGLLDLNGELAESFGKGNYDGSGTLSGLSGAAEATVFNPQESTALFKITGKAEESATSIFLAAGSTKFGLEEATTTFSLGHIGSVELDINGDVKESRSFAPYIGTGSLFSFVSGDESTTVDLPGKTVRLTVEGTAEQSRVRSYVGEGSFKFGGDEATTTFSLGHIGSVQLDVDGDGAESRSFAPYVAEGSLFGFTGAAESVTFNPVERAVLHTFTGTAVERDLLLLILVLEVLLLLGRELSLLESLLVNLVLVEHLDLMVLLKVLQYLQTILKSSLKLMVILQKVEPMLRLVLVLCSPLSVLAKQLELFPQRNLLSLMLKVKHSRSESPSVSVDLVELKHSKDQQLQKELQYLQMILKSFSLSLDLVQILLPEEKLVRVLYSRLVVLRKQLHSIQQKRLFSLPLLEILRMPSVLVILDLEVLLRSKDQQLQKELQYLQMIYRYYLPLRDLLQMLSTRSEVGTGSLFGFTGGDESRLINYAITVGLFAVTGRGLEAFSRANYVGFTESVISGESVDPQGRTPRLIPFRRGRKPQIIVI